METKPGDLEDLAEASGKITQKEAEVILKVPSSKEEAPESQDAAPTAEEDVPDPDEDDLDDLDG